MFWYSATHFLTYMVSTSLASVTEPGPVPSAALGDLKSK
jgi:hypothetical protein